MTKRQPKQGLSEQTRQWIESNPELIERLESLRRIGEEGGSPLKSLEGAEEAVIAEINRLGGETLKQWLSQRQSECAQQASRRPGWRKHSKKNCG